MYLNIQESALKDTARGRIAKKIFSCDPSFAEVDEINKHWVKNHAWSAPAVEKIINPIATRVKQLEKEIESLKKTG
jgi:hypothetical protein